MKPYNEINAHYIGESHIQNGLTCEDYSATYSDEFVSIIVVSDGHGDKNCFRSDKGARYACEISVNLCRQFQNITNHIDDIAHCDFEKLVASLESEIVEKWKNKVLSDAQVHPFTEEEFSKASEQAQATYRAGSRTEKAYGCTLIVSMASANYWLALQIGDGKCVAAYHDGVFVEPIPVDKNCLGNRSTSLCNSNAKESFRHYYSAIKPIAVFASSDGVEESFDPAGLYNFLYSVAYWLKEEGFETTRLKLDDLLPKISEGGSGDDVSLAAMVSLQDNISKPRQTLDQIYERVTACANVLEQCNTNLADTKDRFSETTGKKDQIEKEIAALKEKLEEKQRAHDRLLTECESLETSLHELSAKVQRASEQMDKAEKYKASAERYWFAELERIGIKYQLTLDEENDGASGAHEPQYKPSIEEKAMESSLDGEEGIVNDAAVLAEEKPIPLVENDDFLTVYDASSSMIRQRDEVAKQADVKAEKTAKKAWLFNRSFKQ